MVRPPRRETVLAIVANAAVTGTSPTGSDISILHLSSDPHSGAVQCVDHVVKFHNGCSGSGEQCKCESWPLWQHGTDDKGECMLHYLVVRAVEASYNEGFTAQHPARH